MEATWLREHWRRDAWIAASIVGPVVLLGLYRFGLPGFDAYSYWRPPHVGAALYAGTTDPQGWGTFRYSPAFAQLVSPLWVLSWPSFLALWTGLVAGAYLLLVPRRWWLAGLAFTPFALEIFIGNVHLLLALVIVVGMRYPAAWSFVLLTKVTPGVGLLWFAFRREWRQLGTALVATAAVIAASMAWGGPGLWLDWLRSLAASSSGTSDTIAWLMPPLPVRLLFAAALIAWAAPRDTRWMLPVACLIALPSLWMTSFSILAACAPLSSRSTSRSPRRASEPRLPALHLRRWQQA